MALPSCHIDVGALQSAILSIDWCYLSQGQRHFASLHKALCSCDFNPKACRENKHVSVFFEVFDVNQFRVKEIWLLSSKLAGIIAPFWNAMKCTKKLAKVRTLQSTVASDVQTEKFSQ